LVETDLMEDARDAMLISRDAMLISRARAWEAIVRVRRVSSVVLGVAAAAEAPFPLRNPRFLRLVDVDLIDGG